MHALLWFVLLSVRLSRAVATMLLVQTVQPRAALMLERYSIILTLSDWQECYCACCPIR